MRKLATIILMTLLVTSFFTFSALGTSSPRTIRGYVYVNNNITKPDKVTLSIGSQQLTATLFNDGYYIIDFSEEDGETGTFTVTVDGNDYPADETVTLSHDTFLYKINLHVTVSSNNGGNDDNNGNNGGTGGTNSGGGNNNNGGNNNGGNTNPLPPMNQPPVADADGPYSAFVNQYITFNGSDSYDADGSIVNYTWDFGDGSTGYGISPTHAYLSEGIYTATLTVEDNMGATDSNATTVTVSGYGFNYPPATPQISGPSSGYVNVSYEFAMFSTDNDSATIQYIINWGDGETATSEFIPNGTPLYINHSWSTDGNYTIQVTAYDNNTYSGTAEHTIAIHTQSSTPSGNEEVEEPDYTMYYVALILIILLVILLIVGRRKGSKK